MPKIWFLEASVALTKRFTTGPGGVVQKEPYPHVSDFTSHEVHITNLKTLLSEIKQHAALGHCLIKGQLHAPLTEESRKGATKTNDPTDWLCLDLDRAPFDSPQSFMKSVPALADLSCVVQYSASHGLADSHGLSCHIFVLLDGKINAPYIKAWLMGLNMADGPLREALGLTRSNAALHWPLDITACQNDKLLYIAPPVIGPGVKYTIKKEELIQLVVGKLEYMPVARLIHDPLEKLLAEKGALLNAKREALGIPRLRAKLKIKDEYEIQASPGQMTITGIKEERGFRYFNINGGDSWGYYQPVGDIELVHNFKGEPSYYLHEIAPDYYREQLGVRRKNAKAPTETGDIVMAVREARTGTYWNIVWNEASKSYLQLPAKSELQCEHFLNNYGKSLNKGFIEIWNFEFNPQSTEPRINPEAKRINTYGPSRFYLDYEPQLRYRMPPLIERIIQSAVSNNQNNETYERFLNWLACIFQFRCKTRTAWVLSGTYGTGKGLLITRILAPLLGRQYITEKRNSELEEKWTDWVETALIASIDEVQVSSSNRAEQISQDLKNMITEPDLSIRVMRKNAVLVPNYTNFIFSTNKRDPVQLDAKDRRYNFGDYTEELLEVSDEEIDATLPGELPVFFNYLMQRRADKTMAASILMNETRRNVVQANLTSVDMVCTALATGEFAYLWDSRVTVPNQDAHVNYINQTFDTIMKRQAYAMDTEGKDIAKVRKCRGKLSRDDLMVVFEHCIGTAFKSPNKFTIMLGHHNIKTKKVRIGEKTVYGMEVDWFVPAGWVDENRIEFTPKPPGLKAIPGGKA